MDKEYLVRKANEQAIKLKIVALYDQVFIQQSILEVGLLEGELKDFCTD